MPNGVITHEFYGDAPRVASAVAEFEKLKSRLRSLGTKLVEADLSDKLEQAAADLLTAMHSGDTTGYLKAVHAYILSADAQRMMFEQRQGEISPRSMRNPVPWLGTAHQELQAYIAEDPSNRSVLQQSVFFEDNLPHLVQLDRSVSRLTVPGGDYDSRSFIAGVAVGAIHLR